MRVAIMWFRQDLRLRDNPAFIEACASYEQIIPLYIHDEKQGGVGTAQTWWLHHSLLSLGQSLQKIGLSLVLRKGDPFVILSELINAHPIEAVYWNRCYEPQAILRDTRIKASLTERGLSVRSSNGSLLHEPWEIKNKSGSYFKVFTPYWNHCKQGLITPVHRERVGLPKAYPIESDRLQAWNLLPAKPNWAARFSEYWTPGEAGAEQKLTDFIAEHLNGYKTNRDFPIKNATSRLSPHLHFGEISPWHLVRAIELAKLEPGCDLASAERFLSELGWREFSAYLLYHFPGLPSENFKAEFNAFPWHNDPILLKQWQQGMTGYPIIDAGMRELWATGYMHNRVRMITASFLTKGLLMDWRLGAEWFLYTLLDADLANNSASWQWVAGSGADAAPYFRIFNPVLQSEKFDASGEYIRQWVPELSKVPTPLIHAPWESKDGDKMYAATNYPKPIIDHSFARKRALEAYHGLKNSDS